jgi:hypothetical protein
MVTRLVGLVLLVIQWFVGVDVMFASDIGKQMNGGGQSYSRAHHKSVLTSPKRRLGGGVGRDTQLIAPAPIKKPGHRTVGGLYETLSGLAKRGLSSLGVIAEKGRESLGGVAKKGSSLIAKIQSAVTPSATSATSAKRTSSKTRSRRQRSENQVHTKTRQKVGVRENTKSLRSSRKMTKRKRLSSPRKMTKRQQFSSLRGYQQTIYRCQKRAAKLRDAVISRANEAYLAMANGFDGLCNCDLPFNQKGRDFAKTMLLCGCSAVFLYSIMKAVNMKYLAIHEAARKVASEIGHANASVPSGRNIVGGVMKVVALPFLGAYNIVNGITSYFQDAYRSCSAICSTFVQSLPDKKFFEERSIMAGFFKIMQVSSSVMSGRVPQDEGDGPTQQ